MTPPLAHLAFWAAPEQERVAAFACLRQRDRPAWVPFRNPLAGTEDGFHAVVRHADVVEASRHPDLFGNSPTAASLYDMPPWLARYLDSMINMDGPGHARIRKVVVRAFSPRMLAGIEAEVRERSRRIVDDVLASGSGEFVSRVAQRLPVAVICTLLGLGEEYHELVARHGSTLVGSPIPSTSVSGGSTCCGTGRPACAISYRSAPG